MYTMQITGDQKTKSVIAGIVVLNSGNLTSRFSYTGQTLSFIFRYRSDARIILRRVARSLRCQFSGDRLQHNGAELKIVKTN